MGDFAGKREEAAQSHIYFIGRFARYDRNATLSSLFPIILANLYRNMTLPSFETPWSRDENLKPRLYVLEVRDRRRAESPIIAHIVVEREEVVTRDRDGHLLEAVIRLNFRRLQPSDETFHWDRRPMFSGFYKPIGPDGAMVALTSGSITGGAVFLDLPGLEGQHIGTYLMNEIVVWAKQWPDADVRTISLLASQGDDENRDRRNRFYEQFGISFDYKDTGRRAGCSRPIRAASLQPTDAWRENLKIVRLDTFMGMLLADKRRLASDLSVRTRAVADLREELKAVRRHPFWWATKELFQKLFSLFW